MRTRREVLSASTIAGISSLAGCIGPFRDEDPPLEDLELSIVDVRQPDLGFQSATIPVIIDLFNSHPSDEIPDPTIDWDGFINDNEVVTGISNPETIGPEQTISEEFEFIVDYTDFGAALVDAIQAGSFTVRYEGTIESEGATRAMADSYEF